MSLAGSGPSPLVALVDEDAVLLSRLVDHLGHSWRVRPFSSVDELEPGELATEEVVVAILGPSATDEASLDRLQALRRDHPGFGSLLVVADDLAPQVLRHALRAGVHDAVPLEQVEHELPVVVAELRDRLAQAVAANRVVAEEPVGARPSQRGQIVAVFAPKGGVGRSTIAVNLAASLAQSGEDAVVLVDADLQFGDVAIMLRLTPTQTAADAAAVADKLDTAMLAELLTRHEPTGLYVLAAPAEPSLADQVTPATFAILLDEVRAHFAYVVVDLPSHLDDLVLHAVSEADHVVFPVQMDVPTLKNARLGLQVFELVRIPLERVILVVNRADSRGNLELRDVEKSLQMKADVVIPDAAAIPQAINKGQPVVLDNPRARVVSAFGELAHQVRARAPLPQPEPSRAIPARRGA